MIAGPPGDWRGEFWRGLEPDPDLTITEWANQHRWLSPKAAAEPGLWRTSRTPYLAEIMDSLSPNCTEVREVVFWAGAQVGKTECGNNWIGHTIDASPVPMLVVWPDLDMARKNSRLRIDTLIEESPSLRSKVADAKRASSANTVLYKDFPGGVLVLTGANSSSGLKSMPCCNLFMDEVDKYPVELPDEGDPVKLAIARTRTYSSRHKIYTTSTCTVQGRSRIETSYKNTDQRVYEVPCPECGHFQVLSWKRMKWEKGKPETVNYHCEECGVAIPEHAKPAFLAAGRWRATVEGADVRRRGYWISSLYSPLGWYSWAQAVMDFEEATDARDPAMLKTFVTTVLAETWQDKGEAPSWKRLYRRREAYGVGTVPFGGVFLTAGVDVQKDRVEFEVVAWGPGRESWSIDYGVLPGDPATEAIWVTLSERMAYQYPHANGTARLPVAKVAVDAGYLGSMVYTWCRGRPQAMAVRGRETQMVTVGQPTYVDVNHNGKRVSRGGVLWPVGDNLIKQELYGWLRQPAPEEPGAPFPHGYCHFPEYAEEYFKQLTAERVVLRTVRGYARPEWEKTRERNEALDCRKYARAAAAVVGLDRITPKQWVELEAAILAGGQQTPKAPPPPPPGQDSKPWL